MAKESKDTASFFQTVYDGSEDFDAMRFLVEVEARFQSDELMAEVRWRIDVLNEITSQPDIAGASDALRDKLTQIFSTQGDEKTILASLQDLTEIQTKDGKKVNLRSFLKRDERRVYNKEEYRAVLGKKIANTNTQVVNLIAYFPEAERDLHKLSNTLKGLSDKLKNPAIKTQSVKILEDKIRNTSSFELYEDLKTRFLKDWLNKFTNMADSDLEGLTPGEIQELIQEHQRHQMTRLLKSKIKLVDTDMSGQLGMHDTLEAGFKDEEFWRTANVAAKTGFLKWVMDVVQAFGMLKGQRYAFFQSEDDKELYLLFGLGLSHLPEASEDPVRMIPYLKPFTRKGTYLLEIRKRDIGDSEAYYHELLHYTLPFVFAFDQMGNFNIRSELTTFFTSKY